MFTSTVSACLTTVKKGLLHKKKVKPILVRGACEARGGQLCLGSGAGGHIYGGTSEPGTPAPLFGFVLFVLFLLLLGPVAPSWAFAPFFLFLFFFFFASRLSSSCASRD